MEECTMRPRWKTLHHNLEAKVGTLHHNLAAGEGEVGGVLGELMTG